MARKLLRRIKGSRSPSLVEVVDRLGSNGRSQMIPRRVFQTAESKWIHPQHAKALHEFWDVNPDLDFIVFDRALRDDYMKTRWGDHPIFEVYEQAVFGQMKADIFRYCVVLDHGGYYFDLNKGCSKQLTSIHPPDATGFITYESNPELLFPDMESVAKMENPFNLVAQWAFGFAPGHPLLAQLIDNIVQMAPFFRNKVFRYPKKALLTLTAPGAFTRAFRDYVRTESETSIFEAGEDFFGHGIFRLRGSKQLNSHSVYYGRQRNMPVLEP